MAARKFYAQKDALGFPIPGTMMSASVVPSVSNIIEISLTPGVTVLPQSHPDGLRYYVHLDDQGKILANSLRSGYEIPAGAAELTPGGTKCITLNVVVSEGSNIIEFGLETRELDRGKYVKGTINWGDGSTSAVNILDDGNTDWFTHEYNTEGTFTISVCIDRPDMIQDVELGFDEGNLRISGISNIENWNGIDELDLSDNLIESLTINGMSSLTELYADENHLFNVSIANCPNLDSLNLNSNPDLSSLTIIGTPPLNEVLIADCSFTEQSLLQVINKLNNLPTSNQGGYLDARGPSMPVVTPALDAAIDNLTEKGWIVDVNQASSGLPVKISYEQMGNGVVCNLTETNFNVEITAGTSLSDATTITGDFASLGAYYTPADPNDGMAQPPRFWIAYEVNGIWKNRQFRLTAVGVADGSDAMSGTTQESTCATYWIADRYNIQLGCSSTMETDVAIAVTTGETLQIGKYYRISGGATTDAFLIKSTTLQTMATNTVDPTTAFDTCAAALV